MTLAALLAQLDDWRRGSSVNSSRSPIADPTSLELLTVTWNKSRLRVLLLITQDGVHAALAKSCTCDDGRAHAPEPTRGGGTH